MAQPKKIVNDPADVVEQLLDGIVAAAGGGIIPLGPTGALAKRSLKEGKVGLLIGGGSGHEPLFPGFIGDNLADGAACGRCAACRIRLAGFAEAGAKDPITYCRG